MIVAVFFFFLFVWWFRVGWPIGGGALGLFGGLQEGKKVAETKMEEPEFSLCRPRVGDG